MSSTGRAFHLALSEWRWGGERLIDDSGKLTRLAIDERAKQIAEGLCKQSRLKACTSAQDANATLQPAQILTPSVTDATSEKPTQPWNACAKPPCATQNEELGQLDFSW